MEANRSGDKMSNGLYNEMVQLLTEKTSFTIKLNNKEEINISHYGDWGICDLGDCISIRYRVKNTMNDSYKVTEYLIPYLNITAVVTRYDER